jgi:hypothetical protein
MYALVKDNAVVARESRRTNLFNLPLAGYKTDEELKEIGILPVICDQHCNMATHEMVNPIYNIGKNSVAVTYTIQPLKKKTIFTPREFRQRFTMDEKVAIYELARESVLVQIFVDDMNTADIINIEYSETLEGMAILNSAGILTDERYDELMATHYPAVDQN